MAQKPATNSGHPDVAALQAFVAGRLQLPERDEIARHLESCDACAVILNAQSPTKDPEATDDRDSIEPDSSSTQDKTVLGDRDSGKTQDDDSMAAAESKVPGIGKHANSVPGSSRMIGPYKLLQQIGHGGMGEVYMAEQTQPVRRRVALKLIKAGMDSKEIITRFEAERQALSMMDHQNIARVLDAGTAQDGRPYFVMELVNGIPITEYCDKFTLSLDERLNLFTQACKAFEHAHQKGIIHRDIKPNNVLVTQYDGVPVVKIIDFGLAKALQSTNRLTDKTLFTEFGQVVGTLQYMSPEQAEMNALDIDTRSDVYSLGILLYELLTGSTPIEKQRLRQMALDRVLIAIREEETPRPSHRLSSIGESAAGISAQRKTDPRRLGLILKGDLDWIAMKALEKDRTRRYASAILLAEDITRYLHHETVSARPPSLLYRFRKTIRKHRVVALTGCSLVCVSILAICIGIFATLWFNQIHPSNPSATAQSNIDALPELLDANTSQPITTGPQPPIFFEMLVSRNRGAFKALADMLPLKNGDLIRFSVRFAEPAYARLVWINADGEPEALYPNDPTLGFQGNEAVSNIESPVELDHGWPLEGKSGPQSAVLLVSGTPLPDVPAEQLLLPPLDSKSSNALARYELNFLTSD